jgi:membrane protein DedA with SNARE-associated domain
MKSFLNSAAATAALFIAFTGQAFALPSLPEPGSSALVAVGLVAAVYFLRKGKK